jgi:hypothetical protein
VRKIEHAHHAENQGQPRAEHEEQQPVTEAVEHGDDEKLHKNFPDPLGSNCVTESGFERANPELENTRKKPDEHNVDRA